MHTGRDVRSRKCHQESLCGRKNRILDILGTDERIEMPAKAEIRKTFMIN